MAALNATSLVLAVCLSVPVDLRRQSHNTGNHARPIHPGKKNAHNASLIRKSNYLVIILVCS